METTNKSAIQNLTANVTQLDLIILQSVEQANDPTVLDKEK